MKYKTKSKFSLIKSDIPEIQGQNVIRDVQVGGEKLVYNVTHYLVNQIIVLGFTINIPLFNEKPRHEKRVFLRPYKKNWAHKRKRLPFHEWGKSTKPLTNIWVELENDYMDNIKSLPILKVKIEDQILIDHLKNHETKFTLFS